MGVEFHSDGRADNFANARKKPGRWWTGSKCLLIMQPTCMWQGLCVCTVSLCVRTVNIAALQKYKNSYAIIFSFVSRTAIISFLSNIKRLHLIVRLYLQNTELWQKSLNAFEWLHTILRMTELLTEPFEAEIWNFLTVFILYRKVSCTLIRSS